MIERCVLYQILNDKRKINLVQCWHDIDPQKIKKEYSKAGKCLFGACVAFINRNTLHSERNNFVLTWWPSAASEMPEQIDTRTLLKNCSKQLRNGTSLEAYQQMNR